MLYDGPIIDVDVHHRPKSDAEIVQYLPPQWQRYVNSAGPDRLPLVQMKKSTGRLGLNLRRRLDAFPADGTMPGSSYELTKAQLLDKFHYTRALLNWDLGDYACNMNPYFATALCRAANDWNINSWLATSDDRILSVVIVPSAFPQEAAAEVRRVGKHPRIAGVLLAGNPVGRPFGDPMFHPIYEAAHEMGLVIIIHATGDDMPTKETAHAGGAVATNWDEVVSYNQQAQHYISSFIVHGVFEKYPGLLVQITEYGIAWLPSLMWRLDAQYDALRLESPWVKKWPSEYILSNVRFSTQPIDDSPHRHGLAQLLETVDGIENIICFSTDYPHSSGDDHTYVARQLPAAWHRKVFFENACATFRLDPASEAANYAKVIAVGS